jgi:hypothetical protein
MNCIDIVMPWIKVNMKKRKLNKIFATEFSGKAKTAED